MSVELESKNRIANLIAAANAKTGGSDTNLTSAIGALIAGYGQGGGGDTTVEDALVARTLTSYTNDRVTEVGAYAFYAYTTLQEVHLRNAITAGSNAFNGCAGLTIVDMPSLENAGAGNVFRSCTALEEITLHKLKKFAPSFYGCTSLKKADFTIASDNEGTMTAIGSGTFTGCTSLKTLILRQNEMATLSNVNAFTNTPFGSGGTGGTVYVPAALIESYQTETNWSTLYAAGTCNFVAIEGSEYE